MVGYASQLNASDERNEPDGSDVITFIINKCNEFSDLGNIMPLSVFCCRIWQYIADLESQ